MKTRPESGPIKFGSDWTGIFLRGDNAAHYASAIDAVLSGEPVDSNYIALKSLLQILDSSREGPGCDPVKLKQFEDCTL
jgi:hypothetical protein